ncbi:MAG: glycosyltransferase [Bdellovibrionales bacterium]|nr:glycosyltransferase [Bdellovibrionales bacterium]
MAKRMLDTSESTDLGDLTARMREEWDRRIQHDYRFWMSDGIESDAEMWATGERDFTMLTRGIAAEWMHQSTALEVGCGVGRLLRAAAGRFNFVMGVDVSAAAIEKARRLLADVENVKPMLGNGLDLSEISTASVDFAYTFAAMSSMPVAVIAAYIGELARVVKPKGLLRLQMYLGSAQHTCSEDTIAIRSFSREQFLKAVECAGFDLQYTEEIQLPFEVSNPALGLFAEVVALERRSTPGATAAQIEPLLLPEGEQAAGVAWNGSETEYLMALARARQHLESGCEQEAKRAIEFAVAHYGQAEQEVLDLLEELRTLDSASSGTPPASVTKSTSEKGTDALGRLFRAEVYEQNTRALRDLFPATANDALAVAIPEVISVSESVEGQPVLSLRKLPLSHREKPVRSAERWAERALNNPSARAKDILLVVGFADAYHLEALAAIWEKELLVFEPTPAVLHAACGIRDLRHVFPRISSLITSIPQLREVIARIDIDRTELIIHPQTQATAGETAVEARRLFQSARGLGKLRPSIGVVGPMYGGSLPIAQYTAQALTNLEQRVTPYELDEYYKPYVGLSKFLRDPGRQSVVESQFVEVLSTLVLEAVSERPVDILICLAQAPLSPRVLTELRNRGVITVMWFVEDCRRFLTWQQIAPFYDYMFLIQKNDFPRLVEQAGAGRALYLPVACDPVRHAPVSLSEAERQEFGSAVSFVGAGYNNRRHVFATLADRDFKIWGTEWPNCLPFSRIVQRGGARVSVEDYTKVFNASTININLHSSMERDGVEPNGDFVNPRTFELAAVGAFQLVDNRTLLPELFVPGKEVATFSDEQELHDKIDYYLAHPEERASLTEAARARVLAEHTYEQRVKTMLEHIFADRFDELTTRIQRGPWPRTLQAAKPYPELAAKLDAVYQRGCEPTLDELVGDIQQGKGKLNDAEQKLLFLHHLRGQIKQVRKARREDDQQKI